MPIVRSSQEINGQEVTIYVEVDQAPSSSTGIYGETRETAAERVITVARDVFGEGLALTRNCAAQVVESINQLDQAIRPAEFEVQLAIKLDSEVGAVLAKASAGAQMQVTMKWIHKPD